MSEMASWLGMTWMVSPKRIAPLQNLSSGKTLKKETNEDNDGSDPTNVKGFQPQSVTFDYIASTEAGAAPRSEYEVWKGMVGRKGPLYIGGRRFGPRRLQLKEVGFDVELFDNSGNIITASISLSFQQDGAAESSADNKATSASALNVGPSKTEKEIKMGG